MTIRGSVDDLNTCFTTLNECYIATSQVYIRDYFGRKCQKNNSEGAIVFKTKNSNSYNGWCLVGKTATSVQTTPKADYSDTVYSTITYNDVTYHVGTMRYMQGSATDEYIGETTTGIKLSQTRYPSTMVILAEVLL